MTPEDIAGESMDGLIKPYKPPCLSPVGCRYSYAECGAKRRCKIAKDELDFQLQRTEWEIERLNGHAQAAIFTIILLLIMAVCFVAFGIYAGVPSI